MEPPDGLNRPLDMDESPYLAVEQPCPLQFIRSSHGRTLQHQDLWRRIMPAMFLMLSCSTFAVSPSRTTALVPHATSEIFNPLPAKLYWPLRPAVHQYALRSSPRAPQHYACPLVTLVAAMAA